jgi:hypothetical protein
VSKRAETGIALRASARVALHRPVLKLAYQGKGGGLCPLDPHGRHPRSPADSDVPAINKEMSKSLLLLFFRKEDSSFLKKRSKKLLLITLAPAVLP